MKCYQAARIDALMGTNIIVGWRASGLWPPSSAKPLLNRLLLENSNKLEEEPRKRKAEEHLPEWNADQALFKVPTPQKMDDVRDKVNLITRLGKASLPTARVLFRSITKAIDQQDFVIA